MLRLNAVSLIDVKGVTNSKIEGLDEQMTILTGQNGCGKTTVVEAIAFGLTADKHELGISSYSDLVAARKDSCAVMLTGHQTVSLAPLILQRELIRKHEVYLLNKEEVSDKCYQGTIAKLGVRSDVNFVPVFTQKINKPPKTAADLGEYFGHISGGSDIGWEIETRRESIKKAKEALARAYNDRILHGQEREKSTAYYLVKIYLYDEKIREKGREILMEKENELRMRILNMGTSNKPNSSRVSKKQEPSLRQKLEGAREDLRGKRFYYLRQAQINKITLPYASSKQCVLWPREVKGREDPLSPNSRIQKNPELKGRLVARADGVELDYSSLYNEFSQNPNKELIKARCVSLREELRTIQLEQDPEYKDLLLIQREAMVKKLLFGKQRKIEMLQEEMTELTIQRRDQFYKLFDPVARTIDEQYQGLRDQSQVERHVSLNIRKKNDEKPWRGVEFQLTTKDGAEDFEDITGGEEKLAELALAFALVEATSSPVAIFDDIEKGIFDPYFPQLAMFLHEKSATCQLIVTATNPEFLAEVKELNVPVIEL